jgi:hypothetical protein
MTYTLPPLNALRAFGDRGPFGVRLSDLEPRFIYSANGKRGVDVLGFASKKLTI